jgi:5-methylcytosine rRNA methyltransferase NSUN4
MSVLQGFQKFNSHYATIYGERWNAIVLALKMREKQVLRATFDSQIPISNNCHLPNSCWYEEELAPMAHERNAQGLRSYYIMNPASVIAAMALEIAPSDFVLDMCAAPGGKSLVLLEQLGHEGVLWSNEVSANRREKLINVIRDYVPEKIRPQVFVKGKDGLQYGLKHPETFDKILIDAPCSGERHLILSSKDMEKWSVKRSKRLAGLQYGLICSALLALKSQGQMVYATCSLSKLENDDIIAKLLEKKGDQVELDLPDNLTSGERTKFGIIHLPDQYGFGPIYFSRLRKK